MSYCSLDDSPRPWDEAFFLYHPTKVARALEHEGVAAAARTFWDTPYHKPPLSMFGTLPAIVLFGDGSVAWRVDNLLVALLAGWLLFVYFRRHMIGELAAAFTVLILVSPYAMNFARVEMAELYVWAATILYLLALERSDDLSRRGGCVLFGFALGCGMLSKTSFPMIVVGPSLWVFVRALLSGRGMERRRRLVNLLLAGAVGAALFVPFYAKNWEHIRAHILLQYGWVGKEYGMGNPWTADYLRSYSEMWLQALGGIWTAGALVAAVLFLAALAVRRNAAALFGSPVGALLVGFLVNLVYCYFHPVVDMRFTLGSFLMLQMLVAILAVRALRALGAERAWFAYPAVVPGLVFLLANSFLPGSGTRVIDMGNFLANPLLAPADRTPAIGREILDKHWSPARDGPIVAMTGDHGRLNNDNLRLEMVRTRQHGDVCQLGYLQPGLTPLERIRHARTAGLWIAIEEPVGISSPSWVSRSTTEVLSVLRSNPEVFRELDWRGELPGGSKIFLFRRIDDVSKVVDVAAVRKSDTK